MLYQHKSVFSIYLYKLLFYISPASLRVLLIQIPAPWTWKYLPRHVLEAAMFFLLFSESSFWAWLRCNSSVSSVRRNFSLLHPPGMAAATAFVVRRPSWWPGCLASAKLWLSASGCSSWFHHLWSLTPKWEHTGSLGYRWPGARGCAHWISTARWQ